MKKVLLIVLFGLLYVNLNAQMTSLRGTSSGFYESDSTRTNKSTTVKIDGETKYTDYKIISIKNDTTLVDTTLTIQKAYKHNFTRKDNYDYIDFQNQGQTANRIIYDFNDNSIFPAIGFTAKQKAYYTLNDIYYYHVPTPTTEIMYRSGVNQGQVLDALLTANTSKRLNVSIAYKGLRSTGFYRNTLSSLGNFRTAFSYNTENKRYYVRGHIYAYDFTNQENGGLTEESIDYFETNDSNYTERSRLEVNFTDAQNLYEGKRFYLEQSYAIFSNRITSKSKSQSKIPKPIKGGPNKDLSIGKPKRMKPDSISIASTTTIAIDSIAIKSNDKDSITVVAEALKPYLDFKVGNTLMYETTDYYYTQDDQNSYFGDAFVDEISDHTAYENFKGELYLQLNSAYIGSLKVKTNYFNYNYHYNRVLNFDDFTVSNRMKGNALSLGADWYKKIGNVHLNAEASTIVVGNITGSTLRGSVMFKKEDLFNFKGYAEFTSKTPDFNKQLFQSDYINYNWDNNFKNEDITSIGAALTSEKWGTLQGDYNVVDNYTYFNENSNPEQSSETLTYFKIKLMKEFSYGKFSLDNTVTYQKATNGESFFRTPEWVTRNTLYYSTYMFKGKPLYLQTGVTFKYFSKYMMNAYDPLISEFTLQNEDEIGAFPLLDFFVNIQVSRLRAFFKIENFSASFTGRDYYSAPTHPYRDLTIRFGLVWNFFI